MSAGWGQTLHLPYGTFLGQMSYFESRHVHAWNQSDSSMTSSIWGVLVTKTEASSFSIVHKTRLMQQSGERSRAGITGRPTPEHSVKMVRSG